MNRKTLLKVGRRLVNLSLVQDVKWDGARLYLNFQGGGYVMFSGSEAQTVWDALCEISSDVEGQTAS